MSAAIQRAWDRSFQAQWSGFGCEWGLHLSEGEDPEWVRIIFQRMPEQADLGGYELRVNGTETCIWVRSVEVCKPLAKWTKANSKSDVCGSRFVACGLTWKVDRIDPNHRGRKKLSLVLTDCCGEVDEGFFDELEEITCDGETVCVTAEPDSGSCVPCSDVQRPPVPQRLLRLPTSGRCKMPLGLAERVFGRKQ